MAYKLIDGKLTKVDEEERQAAYSPSSPQSQAVKAKGGGKGSAKDIEFTEGKPSAEQRKRILASQNDNAWGYHDMNTGRYVPWYIDIQDGGGKNTSGDTFQGAGLYSAALNMANVAPYGYNRPRTYAQAGMENRPTGVSDADIEFMNEMVANNNVSNASQNFVRPVVEINELPPANIMNTDGNMGVGTMPTNKMIDPNPMMTTDQIKNMVEPLIQGLLQEEYRPKTVDPIEMIAMLREQENRRRNQPPTLLG